MKIKSELFIFKQDSFQKKIDQIKKIFHSSQYKFQLAYSIKANYHEKVLELAQKNKLIFDCASLDELKRLQKMNIPSDTIWVNTPYLTEGFLSSILEQNIFVFADNFQQLEDIERKTSPKDTRAVGLRICLNTVHSRFGIVATEQNIEKIHSFFKTHTHLELKALNIHYSLRDRSITQFQKRIQEFIEIYSSHFRQYNIETLNFGGGFVSSMSKKMAAQFDYEIPNWDDYANTLKQELHKSNIPHVNIVIEPGMGLVADAFDYEAEVVHIKNQGSTYYALLNTSVLFLKPTGHSKALDFEVKTTSPNSKNRKDYVFVGISCMENDVLGSYNGALEIGTKVLFKNVGAYTLSYRDSFIFNSPKVVS